MKKNFAMRVAACLLVVTMLSLCMVSYTYAKYTTGDKGSDKAQVAKWGVTVTAQLTDLFAPDYDVTDGTVQASGTYDLLAPGTKKQTNAALVISGTPEVATEIIPTVEVTLDKWVADGAYYCPLIVTIDVNDAVEGAKSVVLKGLSYNSEAEFATAIENAIVAALDEDCDAKDDLSKTVKISWEWPFGADVEGWTENDGQTDIKDTILGNAAVTAPATFEIFLSVTINQVD